MSADETANLTAESLAALYDKISTEERKPHECIVHPNGGVCFGCGRLWRLEDGRMVPAPA